MSGAPAKSVASVLLDSRRLIAPIDRRIFGGFLEHVGRAVYGGVFDPGSELSDERGFRRDVLAAVRQLGISAVRYPGGNFASAYDWRDGIGPRGARPLRREPAWEQLEPNTFGTDEFCAWCAEARADPILTVNLGTGSPEEASEWVRYCNIAPQCPTSMRLGPDRAQRPNVKLWCLGNEMDGPWQIGHKTTEMYAQRAKQAARLMRRVDPSIELVLAGSSGDFLPTYMHWDRAVLEECWDEVDFLGVHRYSHNREGDAAWYLAEGVAIDRMIEEFAALLREVHAARGSARPVHLAVDEWNVWYRAKGEAHERGGWQTGAPLLQEGYNLEDALVVGQYLASFIRHADVVKLACLAQIVNALAPIITTPRGLLKQTIYHPFALFSRCASGFAANVRLEGPTYDAGARGQVPAIDVAATYDQADGSCVATQRSPNAAGRWALFLTNRLIDQPVDVNIAWSGEGPVTCTEAWRISSQDPRDANTFAEPDRVIPVAAALPMVERNSARLELRPLSLTVFTFGERV